MGIDLKDLMLRVQPLSPFHATPLSGPPTSIFRGYSVHRGYSVEPLVLSTELPTHAGVFQCEAFSSRKTQDRSHDSML